MEVFWSAFSVHFPLETTTQAPKDPTWCWKEDLPIWVKFTFVGFFVVVVFVWFFSELSIPLGSRFWSSQKKTSVLLSFRNRLVFNRDLENLRYTQDKVEKRWWLNEDKPIAALMERMAAAGGSEMDASGMAYPTVVITCLAPRQQSLPSAFNIGEIYSKDCFLQGKKCLWLTRKDESSFLSILLRKRANKCYEGTKYLWCLQRFSIFFIANKGKENNT